MTAAPEVSEYSGHNEKCARRADEEEEKIHEG
jgi:hypothetical protein